jgi:hypothetical protein
VSGSESNSSAGSSGVGKAVHSVKAAEAPEPGSKKAVKDGSAHPHAGSDARVSESRQKIDLKGN